MVVYLDLLPRRHTSRAERVLLTRMFYGTARVKEFLGGAASVGAEGGDTCGC